MALTTSPITLALENCSIRKPIQLVVGTENQGKSTLNVNYLYEPRKGKPKVGKSGMGSQKGITVILLECTDLSTHFFCKIDMWK